MPNNRMDKANDEDDRETRELVDLSQLPKAKGWFKPGVTLYQGCWFRSHILPNVVEFQQQFQAQDQDIIIASNPKSGTTWLKALSFSILNRARYSPSDTPLLTLNPHQLVHYFEFGLPSHDLTSDICSPRLFSTHIPYTSLPESIVRRDSKCRIVYICRNPLDTIVSFWNYAVRGHPDSYGPEWTMEECVETFCRGESGFGPFWDHVLGFWKASLEMPEKVLFLKYEDLVKDTFLQVKTLAEFLGFPFSKEEESSGVIAQITQLCSLRNLKELEVNKHGKSHKRPEFDYKIFFRKGEVGDWVNHLSPSTVECVNKVIEEKLHGSGLTFKYLL